MNKIYKSVFRIFSACIFILFVSTACTGQMITNKDALKIATDHLLSNGTDLSDKTDINLEVDSDKPNIVIVTIAFKSPKKNEISYGGGFVYTIDKSTGKIIKAIAEP